MQTWKQTFQYDRYGNRTFDTSASGLTTTLGGCPTAACNPSISTSRNRITTTGYGYDANGSLTQDATGQRFVYDAEGHQKEFFGASNSTTTPDATYLYDGEGKRVKKISPAETTVFVYDAGGQLVAEYSTNVVVAAQAQVSYLTQDHLGSPRVTTNENGAVTNRKDFTAFGEEAGSPQRVAGASGNNYGSSATRQDYTGYQKDGESGMEFAQARYYSPSNGRFTSVDPLTSSATIKDPQSFNRYSYAFNSPYKLTDPLGLLSSSTGACGQWCRNSSGGGFNGGTEFDSTAMGAFPIWTFIYEVTTTKSFTTRNKNGEIVAAGILSVEVAYEDSYGAYLGAGIRQSTFERFWSNAPIQNGGQQNIRLLNSDGVPDPANQCAIRFSFMLQQTGFSESFRRFAIGFPKSLRKRAPVLNWPLLIRATDVAKFIRATFGAGETMSGTVAFDRLRGRTGIVLLEDFPGSTDVGRRFNHLDLFNGRANGTDFRTGQWLDGRMSIGNSVNRWIYTARKVTFWEVQ